jgi:phosphoserine phosphatase RsbU/P
MAESGDFSLSTLTAVAASEPSQRVLVVDDDEPLANVMARTLRSRGFECDVAFTGAEARKFFESRDYAVTLLDVKLPDESGYGLLEELRARRPDTAVVMISGVDDPELGKAALEQGAFAYHVKPVGATQLYLLVVNNLRRRGLEIDNRATLDRLEGMVAERAEQMRRAAELQAGMLPASPYKDDGFEIAAHFTAAREISGDFYDWYRTGHGQVIITLGDVMGKGLPASLMMATARAALRGVAGVEPLGAAVSQAANVMSAALEVNHAYVTVFHLNFDPKTGAVQYVDAGHGHARLLRGSTGQELLPQRSAPIGVFPDTQFVAGEAVLNPGDTLVVFSDGLLDLRPDLATKEVQLPYEARRASSAQEMVDILAHGALEKALFDDVTVVALRRLPA